MRFLAIDFGERRIGLAISDPAGAFALPLATLARGATTPTPSRAHRRDRRERGGRRAGRRRAAATSTARSGRRPSACAALRRPAEPRDRAAGRDDRRGADQPSRPTARLRAAGVDPRRHPSASTRWRRRSCSRRRSRRRARRTRGRGDERASAQTRPRARTGAGSAARLAASCCSRCVGRRRRGVLGAAAASAAPFQGYASAGRHGRDPPGAPALGILDRLERAGVIRDARLARLCLVRRGAIRRCRRRVPLRRAELDTRRCSKLGSAATSSTHPVTIVEGWTPRRDRRAASPPPASATRDALLAACDDPAPIADLDPDAPTSRATSSPTPTASPAARPRPRSSPTLVRTFREPLGAAVAPRARRAGAPLRAGGDPGEHRREGGAARRPSGR